ncbi:MAG TPA: DUF4255 domain-containing protein [Pyrinomonadaceae bacterium]|nr:DUF4255 domain-containing protein [Pyrinomonadaceae bacterium]
MSSPLAIAAVTAALKDLLNNGLLDHDLSVVGNFSVTALPPDRIATGQNEPNQLNLFLYQVTPNLGWRNVGLPTRDGNGVRLSAAPLALDLHYLLSAYGSQDLNAEILLGYAMQLLHETPVITREQLRTVLGTPLPIPVDGSLLPGPFGALSAVDLADQMELIKISPVFLSTEDLSKMWTAMQARYRPTMAYHVSVVLIQVANGGKSAPPVLQRGKDDQGAVAKAAPLPSIGSVRPLVSDLLPAMRLGDDLLVIGQNLDNQGTLTALFENGGAKVSRQLFTDPPDPENPKRVTLHVPSIAEDKNGMEEWAIGLYTMKFLGAVEGQPPTNSVPIALAPLIIVSPLNVLVGDIELTVECTPRLRPEQETQTSLIFGSRPVPPTSIDTPSDDVNLPSTLVFRVPSALEGEYMVRLRVQGIDSLPVRLTGTPPRLEVDPQQTVKVTVL